VTTSPPGVTFVLPVYNGRKWLRAVLDAIAHQRYDGPIEIIAVDDGSRDGSKRLLREAAAAGVLTMIEGPCRGSAAAVNAGIRHAMHPIICQVDQDVVLQPEWLATLVAALDDPAVAAAQGHYITAPDAGVWARMMGRDLEQRYGRIRGDRVDHVCTGNSAYRASALHQVGLLDETLGYGSDNDLSYRLTAAGYRLVFCRTAVSVHHWREGLRGYLQQQFGVGYGRLDVLARHPTRAGGDDVSGAVMMAHGPVMLSVMVALAAALAGRLLGSPSVVPLAVAGAAVALLAMERLCAGILAWRRSGDRLALAFVAAHLMRDAMWAVAIVVWLLRRGRRSASSPAHSMRRAPMRPPMSARLEAGDPRRILAIVPAFNEAPNLTRVVLELRKRAPTIDILVLNDGSTDDTAEVVATLDVKWLTLTERVGVGGAVRAGLRYAHRHGYAYVVRVDGDGQHRPCDIPRLLHAVGHGVDAAIGSRYLDRPRRRVTILRWSQAALARCVTFLTGRRFTDPTSGFWLFGPRAVRLLGRYHPTGYAEPELILFLSRNGLRVDEVPIRMRPRRAGRTSLTPTRTVLALFRTLLALMIVPARNVESSLHD
jgi:glycosyltransferase involved in cell wall biosynthesis